MSCNNVSDFVKKQREDLSKQDSSLDILSNSSPLDVISKGIHDTMSAISSQTISLSPLESLGKDFLAEQISKNGKQIIDNATGALKKEVDKIAKFDVRKTIEEAQKQVYNTIAAAITADSDLSMIFLQKVAQNAVNALNEKKTILLKLKEKVAALHNALRVLVSGQPYFNAYLEKLRQGLLKIRSAQTKVDSVKNTYIATKRFLPGRFNEARTDLEAAYKLIAPENQKVDNSLIAGELLQNVGIPSTSQQLSALIAVPQLAQEVAFAASGYFIATLKANALLLAFTTGYDAFKKSSSKLLDNYSIDMLNSLSDKISNLSQRMATELNGNGTAFNSTDYARSPLAGVVTEVTTGYITVSSGTLVSQVTLKPLTFPKVAPGDNVRLGQQLAEYRPDSIKVSTQSLGWLLELRAIIDYMSLIPGSTLNNIQVSASAVDTYNTTTSAIKKKGNRVRGDAVLTATEGREELGQLEAQLQTLILRSVRAITNPVVASGVTALARTILTRLDLSLEQDGEIIKILQGFISAPVSLKSTLPSVASGIRTALRNSGMDRAADLLDNGQFEDFFNLNSKTATYAGAALVGIALLKQCLGTVEDQDKLVQAERTIQREVKAKELLAQRTSVAGFQQQKAINAKNDQALSSIQSQAQEACNKCGIPEDFNPSRLLIGVTNVLGISSLGSVTLPSSLGNIGKGFL